MNNIKTNSIFDPGAQQPFTGPSLTFLQATYKEALSGVAQGIIGNSYVGFGVGYSLYGVIHSGSVVSTGYIYLAGEIYLFNGINNYNTFSNGGVFVLVTTQDPVADPAIFSDLSSHDVHDIRRLNLIDQVNGSGLFDFASIVYVQNTEIASTATNQNSYTGTISVRHNAKTGFTYLKGVISYAGVPGSTSFFNIPAGYRPSSQKKISALFLDNSVLKMATLIVNTNGDCGWTDNSNTTDFSMNLDGVSFYTGW